MKRRPYGWCTLLCSNRGWANISLAIDNRGERRDRKRLYMYADDARHGHVTNKILRIAQLRYTSKGCVCCPRKRETCWCTPAESPEVPKSKEERIRQFFLNRFVGGLPIGLEEFSWDLYLVKAFVKCLARSSVSQRVLTSPSSTSLL